MNKNRFWTGIGMGIAEFVAVIIYFLTKVDWSWVTAGLIIAVGTVTMVILYNAIAMILVWNGSRKECRTKKQQ